MHFPLFISPCLLPPRSLCCISESISAGLCAGSLSGGSLTAVLLPQGSVLVLSPFSPPSFFSSFTVCQNRKWCMLICHPVFVITHCLCLGSIRKLTGVWWFDPTCWVNTVKTTLKRSKLKWCSRSFPPLRLQQSSGCLNWTCVVLQPSQNHSDLCASRQTDDNLC